MANISTPNIYPLRISSYGDQSPPVQTLRCFILPHHIIDTKKKNPIPVDMETIPISTGCIIYSQGFYTFDLYINQLIWKKYPIDMVKIPGCSMGLIKASIHSQHFCFTISDTSTSRKWTLKKTHHPSEAVSLMSSWKIPHVQ